MSSKQVSIHVEVRLLLPRSSSAFWGDGKTYQPPFLSAFHVSRLLYRTLRESTQRSGKTRMRTRVCQRERETDELGSVRLVSR